MIDRPNTITHWKVLLVDDELDSLRLLHDMLALQNIEVRSADGGAAGLALLEQFTPTLVIVDLSMPKPDGWDVLAAVRSRPELAELPVVAITAYPSDKVIAQARKAGFSALIPKPIKLNTLLGMLQNAIDKANGE